MDLRELPPPLAFTSVYRYANPQLYGRRCLDGGLDLRSVGVLRPRSQVFVLGWRENELHGCGVMQQRLSNPPCARLANAASIVFDNDADVPTFEQCPQMNVCVAALMAASISARSACCAHARRSLYSAGGKTSCTDAASCSSA